MSLPDERINILRELGEEIRARREELGISFDDIYQKTRIRQSYLEALETANYEVLPDAVYTLGFIRTYLGIIKFDDLYPEFRHWLMKNTRAHGKGKDAGEIGPYDLPTPGFKLASRFWVFAVLLLIVFGAATYVTYSWSKNGMPIIVPRNEQKTENRELLSAVLSDDVSEEIKSEDVSIDVSVVNVPLVEPEAKKPELKIIAANDDCWISIRVGNGKIEEKTLKKGETITMELSERTRVNYGRPWAVNVIHNGLDIGSPYKSGARKPQVNFYDPDGRSGRIEARAQP